MNDLNDTAKLYQLFGGQASDYQELRREHQANTAKQRWPLLAWLDLSALHVSEPPKVQLGETPSAAAKQRFQSPMAPAAAVGKAFAAPLTSPAPALALALAPTAATPAAQAFGALQAPKTNPTQDVAPFLKNLFKQEDPAMAATATALSGFSGMAGSAQQATSVTTVAAPAPSPVLRDIFARIAQPAQSQPAPAPQGMPGNIWANLSSKL